MPDKTRWAILGTGAIAARFAADLRHSRLGRLAAVGSRTPERARAFADQFGPGIAADDIDTLLACGDIDAVYLATPNERHGAQALTVLAAGKPVLVEKPFAVSAAEVRQVADAARQSGLLAMEAMWMRFTPGIVRLKRIVDEGHIGALRRIDVALAYPQAYDPASPLYDVNTGGALLDLGVYPLSLAVHLAGIPRSIEATLVRAPNGAVAAAGILLGFDGAVATLSCGFDAEGRNTAVITGTEGIVETQRPVLSPPMLSLRRTGRPSSAGPDRQAGLPPISASRPAAALQSLRPLFAGLRTQRFLTLSRGSGLHHQADHFSVCLQEGITDSPIMPLGHSVAVIELVERAMAAAGARG